MLAIAEAAKTRLGVGNSSLVFGVIDRYALFTESIFVRFRNAKRYRCDLGSFGGCTRSSRACSPLASPEQPIVTPASLPSSPKRNSPRRALADGPASPDSLDFHIFGISLRTTRWFWGTELRYQRNFLTILWSGIRRIKFHLASAITKGPKPSILNKVPIDKYRVIRSDNSGN